MPRPKTPPIKVTPINKWEASNLTSLSWRTLRDYRLSGRLAEGVYWIRLSSRAIRYYKEPLEQWIAQGFP